MNLLKLATNTLPNAVACALRNWTEASGPALDTVVQDANGVPVAWRLFGFGPFTITRNGETTQGEFTPEAADAIIAYYAQKGTKIPLDSEHFLYRLAEHLKVDESDVRAQLGTARGTFGYAALEKRADGLWIVDAEYVPLAYNLMAEGILRYFSPVLRGLSDGRLRITSVAFTNTPAIDQLDAIAAAAESEAPVVGVDSLAASLDALPASINPSSQAKGKTMNKLLTSLAALPGMDSLSLSADGSAPESIVQSINDLGAEVTTLRIEKTAQKSFLAALGDKLALGAEPTLETAQAAIMGLVAKAEQADSLKTRVDALELSAETGKRQAVIDAGLAAGKLTKAMIDGDWCKSQDSAALSAFLKTAPVVVPVGKLNLTELPEADTVALTAEDRAQADKDGMTADEFLAAKKQYLS